MKTKMTIAVLTMCLYCQGLLAQPPLVYNVENTGAAYPTLSFPYFNDLQASKDRPVVFPLTDPFAWSNGSGRTASFSDWSHRRNEIKQEIEHYEIGKKPAKPAIVTATWTKGSTTATQVNGTLRVVSRLVPGGDSVVITSAIQIPATPAQFSSQTFPAIIGMNSAYGGLPTSLLTPRNIAGITFSHNNVTTYGSPSLNNPYYRLYPDQNLNNAGQYSAWAWGVSRIIDGLEIVQGPDSEGKLPINLSRLGVSGCSYAGKMALFSSAFDERIALAFPLESGGGGVAAWRVAEYSGHVEKLGATDYRWFTDSMSLFAGLNTAKLPYDHHELLSMIAPRAVLLTGNTQDAWLSNPACYVSARAAHEVWKAWGIGDRMGFIVDGGHGHCAIPASQNAPIAAFLDKFLLGDQTANTDVTTHPYPTMDYQRWFSWWGSGNPTFSDETTNPVNKWLEPECGVVGNNWNLNADATASNGIYTIIRNGLNSTGSAPANTPANQIVIPFTIEEAGTYNFIGRCRGANEADDSYYVKIDNGTFVAANGHQGRLEWQWGIMTIADLAPGNHTFTITYREDGAWFDKLLITTSNVMPVIGDDLGEPSTNCGPCSGMLPPAGVLYVNQAIAASGDGSSWPTAMKELRDAIAYANTHPEITSIWVAKGTYKATDGSSRTASFTIKRNNLHIIGGFDGTEVCSMGANPVTNLTVASGDIGAAGNMTDNSLHVFTITGLPATGNSLVIENILIEKGMANISSGGGHYGAGVFAYSNPATAGIMLRRVILTQNSSSYYGGAVGLYNSPLQMDSCGVALNTAVVGGAGLYSLGSKLTASHTLWQQNISVKGAAIYADNGNLDLSASAFVQNVASESGGAIYQNQSPASVTNTVFSQNQVGNAGGAVYQHNSNSTYNNATFYANKATANGGAVFAAGSSVVMANNSIFHNNTRAGNSSIAGSDLVLGNPAASYFKNNMLQQNTLVMADNGSQRVNNVRGQDPMFSNAAVPAGLDGLFLTSDDGLQLTGSSPAINSGDNSLVPAGTNTDIIGQDRISCGLVDRGAYERMECPPTAAASIVAAPTQDNQETWSATIAGNPFTSELKINYTGTQKGSLTVYDVNGKIQWQQQINVKGGLTRIATSNWHSGYYKIALRTASGETKTLTAIKAE